MLFMMPRAFHHVLFGILCDLEMILGQELSDSSPALSGM
jgi:hypothetical protein